MAKCATKCTTFSKASCPDYCATANKDNGLCLDIIPEIKIGGKDGRKDRNGALWKPQFKVAERYNQNTNEWEPCTGQESEIQCFEGWARTDSDQLLKAGVKKQSQNSVYPIVAAEFMIQCEFSGEIEFKIMPWSKIGAWNGDSLVRAWYNGTELTVNTQKNFELKVPVSPTDVNPTFRIELSRPNDSKNAYAVFKLAVLQAPVWFTKCMGIKQRHGQCLDELVDQTNIPAIRDDHGLQVQCLQATTNAERNQIPHCKDWVDCLLPDTAAILLKTLNAFDMVADVQSSLIQISDPNVDAGGTAGCAKARSCIDPSIFDIEAFDCKCWEELEHNTSQEIHKMACNHELVCCHWVESHCQGDSSSLAARARQEKQIRSSAYLEEDEHSNSPLEASAIGKCSS